MSYLLQRRFQNFFFRDPVIFIFLLSDPLKFLSPLQAYQEHKTGVNIHAVFINDNKNIFPFTKM